MVTIRSLRRVWLRVGAAPLPLLSIARTSALRRRSPRIGVTDRDLAAVREPDETGGDDALVGFNAALYDSLRLILFLNHNRPHCRGIIVLDHIDESPVRPALHGSGWNHQDLLERIDQQADVDELSRPELQPGIWEFSFQLHRAGCLVHLVVNDPEYAAVDYRVIVRPLRFDGQRALIEGRIYLRQILLR